MSLNFRIEFNRVELSNNRVGYVAIKDATAGGNFTAMKYFSLEELYAFANELFKEAAAIEAEQNLKAANPMYMAFLPFYKGPLS